MSRTLSSGSLISLEEKTSLYEKSLPLVLPYLAARGITEETARRFRLGYVDEAAPDDERFQHRLVIPYLRPPLTKSGRPLVLGHRFRDTSGGTPKYLSTPGSPPRLFNVRPFFSGTSRIGITEGELDAVILDQIGCPGTGVPGATSWNPIWARLFEDFDDILILCDADEAGRNFGNTVSESLGRGRIVTMPVDDVNSTFLHPDYGADYLRSLFG